MKTTVESASGLELDLVQPMASQVAVTDIVHALAMQPRLLGAVSQRYSIAQHILLVYDLLQGLMHPAAGRMFLLYFISRSHAAFIGDIPRALREPLAAQMYFNRLLTRLNTCVAQHMQAIYGLPPGTITNEKGGVIQWTSDQAVIMSQLLNVCDAYETYHLMAGGGWSMQPPNVSAQLTDFAKAIWMASKRRFQFDVPPPVLAENAVQGDLLKRLASVCITFSKEVAA